MFGKTEQASFLKLFSSRNRIREENLDKARSHLGDLMKVSEQLLGAIDRLENDVRSMGDENFHFAPA